MRNSPGPTGKTSAGSWLPTNRLHALLARSDLDPSVVRQLRHHWDEGVARAAACHIASGPLQMDQETLARLQSISVAKDSIRWEFNDRVASLVASAICLGIIPYRRMENIPEHICAAAARDPDCPPTLRAVFMKSPDAAVRQAARKGREPMHRTVETPPSRQPERMTPARLKTLARSKNFFSRFQAASNPRCSLELLREVWANHPPELPIMGPLSRERHMLMACLLARVDLPVDLLLDILAEHFRPYRAATHDPQFPWRRRKRPAELFETVELASYGELLMPDGRDPVPVNRHDISLMIAEHPSCPPEWRTRILRFLIEAGLQNRHVRLARDPEGNPLAADAIRLRVLRTMLDHPVGAPVRWLALESHFCEPEMLAEAATSHAWLERVSVAGHARTPPSARQTLRNDGIQWVRWAAEQAGELVPAPDDMA